MRSRYSAYALGLGEYLLQSWHPSTRPSKLELDDSQHWIRLKIHSASGNRVSFTATFKSAGKAFKLIENSRFALENNRWYYLDGESG